MEGNDSMTPQGLKPISLWAITNKIERSQAMLESREKQEPQGLKRISSAVDSGMAKAMPSQSDRAMSSEADRAMPSRAHAMDRGGEG